MADQDREITLNTGKLLGFFFGIVILCGFFFVAGFTLGKSAVPAAPSSEILPLPSPAATAAKPPSAKAIGVKDCSATPEGCPPIGSNELAFSKTADSAANPAPVVVSAAPAAQSAPAMPAAAAAPEIPKTSVNYIVQVAAVSKQQDAEALASALRKKNYAVTVITPISDNLFRVQVGPFAEVKEAEAMRTRSLSDGYNPIVKR